MAAQIGAAIRSGELDRGRRLPSSRRLSHSLGLHRHTVRAAYADLARLGLVRLKPRSGVFVSGGAGPGASSVPEGSARSLDADFAEFLRTQRSAGCSARDLNELMNRWANRSSDLGVVVVEVEPALRRLISVEIASMVPGVSVAASSCCQARRAPETLRGRCVVARQEVAAHLRGLDPAMADLVVLRTAPVAGCRHLLRDLRAGEVVTLLTRSRLLRSHAREVLAGDLGGCVGLACPRPSCQSEVDRALRISSLVLADATFAPHRSSTAGVAVRAVRVVDREWIGELARYMDRIATT